MRLYKIVAALLGGLLLAALAGCDQTGSFQGAELTRSQIEARIAETEARVRSEAEKDAAEAKIKIEIANRKAQSLVKRADLDTQAVAMKAADDLAEAVGEANATLDARNSDRQSLIEGIAAQRASAYAEIDRKNAAISSVLAFAKPFAAAVPGGSEGIGLLQSLLVGAAATGIGGTVLQTVRANGAKKDLKSIINGMTVVRHKEPAVKAAMKAHKDAFEGQLTAGAKHAIVAEAL